MQSAQDWHRQNTADRLDAAGYRRILIQGKMRPGLIVVIRVRSKQMPKMLLAKYDDMVKAVASDRADQPFTIPVVPVANLISLASNPRIG